MKLSDKDQIAIGLVLTDIAPKIGHWTRQFMTDHYKQSLYEMEAYLDTLNKNPQLINLFLLQFLMEFSSNIKIILQKEHLIMWEDVLVNNELIQLFDVCTRSIQDMKNWVNGMSKYLHPFRRKVDHSPTAIIETIQRYIQKNLSRNLTRTELSDLVYIHPDYLSHVFREQTGISLREYIAKERIFRAQHLLCHTNLSISVIASECGYENAAYFSKTFKKINGVTPKEFKTQAVTPTDCPSTLSPDG